jgi:serine-type D-Ala-D-Ala carboxypeptidase (penicillin-binding protein 5/6)
MTFKSSLLKSLVVAVLATFAPISAQGQEVVETVAKYAVLMDAQSGDVFFDKDGDVAMAPASMSKLMTVAVLFDALKSGEYALEDTFPVSKKAWQKPGSKMWVLVGADIKIEDLLRGIIIQSGNDACIVVAEGMSGSEEAFAKRMTEFGKEIGLTNSNFTNSTGWPDPNHLMSSRDLAVLARYLILEHPELYGLFAETEFEWSDIPQPNRNPLLFMNIGADGLKTGHTEASGYGLVGSAMRNGRRVVMVLNGMTSKRQRAEESRRIMNTGFREFRNIEIFAKGAEVGRAQVWKGQVPRVRVITNDPIVINIHRRARKGLEVKLVYKGPVQAPIAAGAEIGVLKITAPGMAARSVPVYAGQDVGLTGLRGQIWEALAFKFYGLREG